MFYKTLITEEWDWIDPDKQIVNTKFTKETIWFGFLRTKRTESTLKHLNYGEAKSKKGPLGFARKDDE